MIRSTFSRALLGLALSQAVLLTSACSSDSSHEAEAAASGTFVMPLLASAGGHNYRLQGALYVSGPTFLAFDLNTESPTLSANLPSGTYLANLYAWSLTLDDGSGNFVPVSANLASSSVPTFTIFNQTTTAVSFQFETDGQLVTVGSGRLNIDVTVSEATPVCAPLGGGCPAGSWCAPSELTGSPLRCVAAGPTAEGAACSSPTDCAANTSCFDFGSGAVCARLCSSADFNQPCASGSTCTPQGADYGVCTTDAAAAAGSGGSE